MNCPLCKEPIEDNQSRVRVYFDVCTAGDKHTGSVAYCHRRCVAEKWPEFYQWSPPPKRS